MSDTAVRGWSCTVPAEGRMSIFETNAHELRQAHQFSRRFALGSTGEFPGSPQETLSSQTVQPPSVFRLRPRVLRRPSVFHSPYGCALRQPVLLKTRTRQARANARSLFIAGR